MTFSERVIGAAVLDVRTYEEIEALTARTGYSRFPVRVGAGIFVRNWWQRQEG